MTNLECDAVMYGANTNAESRHMQMGALVPTTSIS